MKSTTSLLIQSIILWYTILSLSLSLSFPRISVPYVTLVLFLFSVWIIMCCKVYTLNGKLLRCAPWYFLFWVFQGKKKYARVLISEENKSLVSVEMLRGTFGFVYNQIVHHNLYKLLIVKEWTQYCFKLSSVIIFKVNKFWCIFMVREKVISKREKVMYWSISFSIIIEILCDLHIYIIFHFSMKKIIFQK